jgi:uncharacterized protein YciI
LCEVCSCRTRASSDTTRDRAVAAERAFERMDLAYYQPLCAFVTAYVGSCEASEELVQDGCDSPNRLRRGQPMAYFLLRLIPPRPTFPIDMTDAEREVMQDHVTYWTALAERGVAIAFGPVADPTGAWGVAILEVEDLGGARALSANDPAMTSNRGFATQIIPMPRIVLRTLQRLDSRAAPLTE